MLQYSDTTTYNGIIQEEERLAYSADYGRISGNTAELASWTIRNNQALSRAMALMLRYQDNWQVDDWNHASINTATENIVSGTRDIALTTPEDILFLLKVLIRQDATTTDYTEIYPIDIRQHGTRLFAEGDSDRTGIPYRYDKVGGYISLDPIPDYSATAGLKYYYQRTPHQFTTSDTTAKAGIPALFDRLIPLYAVDIFATENTNMNLKQMVGVDIARMEMDIAKFMSQRSQDDEPKLRAVQRPTR